MPAMWITLDRMDGTTQVKGPLYPDEIDLTGLLFRLNERDLASVTFAHANPLGKMTTAADVHAAYPFRNHVTPPKEKRCSRWSWKHWRVFLASDRPTTADVVIYEHIKNDTEYSPSCCYWIIPNTVEEKRRTTK